MKISTAWPLLTLRYLFDSPSVTLRIESLQNKGE